VGGVGEKAAQALLRGLGLRERLFQPGEHAVQRDADAADLRPGPRDLDAAVQLTRGDGVSGRGDPVHRPELQAHQHRGQRDQQQHDDDDDRLLLEQAPDRAVGVRERDRDDEHPVSGTRHPDPVARAAPRGADGQQLAVAHRRRQARRCRRRGAADDDAALDRPAVGQAPLPVVARGQVRVGRSFGGIITANMANRWQQLGIPKPQAIWLDDPHDGGLTGFDEPALTTRSPASRRRRRSSATPGPTA
jgi:hypothetical protein